MRISDWSSDVCSSDLTTSITIIRAGNKDNVLPSKAHATINFRILPGDNADTVFEHLKNVVNDERVVFTRFAGNDADADARSEESRVGNECGRTCRSRWSTLH